MQVTFTRDLEELAAWYRRQASAAVVEKGAKPVDTSGIEVRTDKQIGSVFRLMGWMHHFETNHWFSFVSWSRETEDPNTIRIVIEGDDPEFETICQAIALELSN
jgi:hypothetical protein